MVVLSQGWQGQGLVKAAQKNDWRLLCGSTPLKLPLTWCTSCGSCPTDTNEDRFNKSSSLLSDGNNRDSVRLHFGLLCDKLILYSKHFQMYSIIKIHLFVLLLIT